MERRFDMSDFEQSLKDHADQFRLIPSSRVWNGIYNNLHPGSKWPSISVAIVLLITLVTIGNLNNSPRNQNNQLIAGATTDQSQSVNKEERFIEKTESKNISAKIEKHIPQKNILEIPSAEDKIIKGKSLEKSKNVSEDRKISSSKIKSSKQVSLISFDQNILLNPEKDPAQIVKNNSNQLVSTHSILLNPGRIENGFNEIRIRSALPLAVNNDLIVLAPIELIAFESPVIVPPDLKDFKHLTPGNNSLQNSSLIKSGIKKPLRKKNKNAEWTFFVTPLVSSVSFEKRSVQPQNPSAIVVLTNQPTNHPQLIRNPKIGFETGAEMTYRIFDKLKFITGVQLNYSSYNNVSNLVHPTFGNLILQDKSGTYAKSYLTHYGNGQSPSQISLINYNLQACVPVGLQFNIWNNKNIAIDIASVIAPSYVLKGNAYIISSDNRYYINDPTLIRKFNLAASFGSYITFKANKIKWHIGPDFRYQLLSTYKNIYTNKEHFLDYGIRIGISR